jgi:hypothetical protein
MYVTQSVAFTTPGRVAFEITSDNHRNQSEGAGRWLRMAITAIENSE